jgi:signal transduction histidine kinase
VTNAAKHAQAQSLSVAVAATDGNLSVTVADDGVGGADTGRGSGLSGLADRVAALGGRLEIDSPRGDGTRMSARLPTQVLGSLNGFTQASS